VKELMMLTQAELERERYQARRRAQLEVNTALKAERIYIIRLLERKLERPETPTDQLAQRSLDDLSQLIDQLVAQLSRPS
jgi:hypothetical protein